MKIARKEFIHPAGHFEKPKDFLWWNDKDKQKWVAHSVSEVRQQVFDFVNEIGKERLVNICEYATHKSRRGDDGVTHFVVYYWEQENGQIAV